MKKNLVVLSMMAALAMMTGFAFAGAGIEMRINVPFDFYLDNQLLPNGEYIFQMDSGNYATGSHVVVVSNDGKENRMLFASPGTDRSTDFNQLSFNKYGDKYFLSSILIGGHKASLKVYGLEQELRSQMNKKQSTVTVAQK
ncbi:MAG: hypothetical protein JXA73_03240 [Acidobacteria bacterium]|nr:hypothetical protein [Acidobacteriota bacterium]